MSRFASDTNLEHAQELKILDILGFEIKEDQRDKGYGRALYLIVEEFARETGYRKVQTSPSGQGVTFWPYMGLTQPCEFGVEKILS